MASSSSSEKTSEDSEKQSLVDQMVEITGRSANSAQQILTSTGWSLEEALGLHFAVEIDENLLEDTFEKKKNTERAKSEVQDSERTLNTNSAVGETFDTRTSVDFHNPVDDRERWWLSDAFNTINRLLTECFTFSKSLIEALWRLLCGMPRGNLRVQDFNEWLRNLQTVAPKEGHLSNANQDVREPLLKKQERELQKTNSMQGIEEKKTNSADEENEVEDEQDKVVFYNGTFSQALIYAFQNDRVLLMYVHTNNSSSEEFGKRVLTGNSQLAKICKDHLVLWGVDGFTSMGHHVARQLLGARALPYLVALLPTSSATGFNGSERWKICGRPLAGSEVEVKQKVMDLVNACVDEKAEASSRAEAARLQRLFDRELRDEQDREYIDGLEKDRIRMEEQEKKKKESHTANWHRQNLRAKAVKRREAAVAEIRAARECGHHDSLEGLTCEIVVKLPTGKRVTRRFLRTDPVSRLFAWTDVMLIEHDVVRPDGDDTEDDEWLEFSLATAFPVKNLTNSNQVTIEEAGLSPNAVLFVRSIELDSSVQTGC